MTQREELFTQHQGWALAVAARLARRLPRFVERDGVRSAALEGLWDAAGRWDGMRRFRTFAYIRINGSVRDWLRQQQPLGLRRPRLKLSLRIHSLMEGQARILIDPRSDQDQQLFVGADTIRRLLQPLNARQRLVIQHCLIEGRSQVSLARQLGLCEERISQLRKVALRELREHWNPQPTSPVEESCANATN